MPQVLQYIFFLIDFVGSGNMSRCFNILSWNSSVAKAFPGGRLAHPEAQNEEENK